MSDVRSLACGKCHREVTVVPIEQAAELKGVHRRTVYRWIKQGKAHLIRIPGEQRYLCQESLLNGHRSLGHEPDFSAVDPRIRQIVELVEEQYHDPSLMLSKLCRQLRVSYSNISRLFKQQTGTNFRWFLMDVRMKKAAELLSTTRPSIKAIAADVGYKHVSDFCYHFKLCTG